MGVVVNLVNSVKVEPMRFIFFFCLYLIVSACPHAVAQNFAHDNTQLQDTLALQDQIQTLKKLIEHETQVNNMAQAAKDIGFNNPILPAPEQELCSTVSANIPCAQAYSDLYPGYKIQREEKPVVHSASVTRKPSSKNTSPVIVQPALYWLDITCLQQSCSALVASEPNNAQTWLRVRAGQSVAGGVIQTITADGVIWLQNKKSIAVPPAPRS